MPRKVYTQEFRDTAIRLVRQPGVSCEKVANELGIACWTLRRWMKEADTSPARRQQEGDLQRRVRELEAENRTLRMERDILKKATAFFARERP